MDASPLWWLTKLNAKLDQQGRDIQKYADYYDGKQPLSFTTLPYRRHFEQMLKTVSDNWMPIIVDSVNERLHIDGFRFGTDPSADADAWDIWQWNYLDSNSELLHLDSLKLGTAAVLVWRDEVSDRPVITVEHPTEVYVATSPGNRRNRTAALKRWHDEWTDLAHANLFLPDAVYKFAAKSVTATDWVLMETLPNPLGVVPVVPFHNRVDTFGRPRSELDGFLSTQDQINKVLADMLVASEYGAFRQRWATGLEVPTNPDTGQPVQPFEAAIHRLWVSPDPDTRFGDFTATDLTPYLKAIENRIQSLASRSRTPPHYMLNSGTFPNGESIKSAETGLVSKVRSRQRFMGEAWEEVLRLAFAVIDDGRRYEVTAETIWADPETRTESEHTDSLVKQLALGVPKEALWAEAGYSPSEIARFKVMLQTEALNTALAQPFQLNTAGMMDDGTEPLELESSTQ